MAKKDFAISLRLQSQQFKTGIQQVQSQLNSFKGLVTKAFVGLGVAEFGKKLIKAASNLETLDTNLGTLLGSMDKGVALRKELQKYGESTPYDTDGLVKATQTMLGYGVAQEKVMPIMKQLGDIAMGDTNKLQSLALAYSQMTSAGKVMKQDMNQMANAGFGFNQVAASMGISVGELNERISKGKVHIEDINKALKEATSQGGLFYNSAVNGSSTFEGIMSNLEESVTNTLATVGQSILPTAKQVASSISNLIESMSGTISNVANAIGKVLSFIVDNARSVGVAIASMFGLPKVIGAITAIQNYWKTTQNQIVSNALASTTNINRLQKQVTSLESQESKLRVQIEKAEANEKLALQVQYNARVKELSAARTNLEKAQSQQRIQLERAESVQLGGMKGKIVTLGSAFATLGTTIKAALSTTIITAAITAFMTLGDKIVQVVQRTKEVNNQISDYKKRIESVQYNESVARLNDIYNAIRNSKNQTAELKKYQNELNSNYGISINQANGKLKKEKDITDEIRKQISLLKNRAEMDALSDELKSIYKSRQQFNEKYNDDNRGKGTKVLGKVAYTGKDGKTHYRNATASEKARYNARNRIYNPKNVADNINPFRGNNILNDLNEQDNNDRLEKDITRRMSELSKDSLTSSTTPDATTPTSSTSTGKTGSTKSDPIADANKDYAKAIKVAEAKLNLGLINQQERDDEIISAKEALINAYLENGKTISNDNQFVKDIQEKALQKFKDDLNKNNPYSDENRQRKSFDKSFELPKTYNADSVPLNDIEKDSLDITSSLERYEDKLNDINEQIQEQIQYYHQLEEAAKQATNDNQKAFVNNALDEVSNNLDSLKHQATSLNDAIRIDKIKQDLNDVNKSIEDEENSLGLYKKASLYIGSIRDSYQNIVGLAQDWANVGEKEGFEKVLAIFDALFGTLERIDSIFESWKNLSKTLENISNLFNKKQGLENKISDITNGVSSTSVLANGSKKQGSIDLSEIAQNHIGGSDVNPDYVNTIPYETPDVSGILDANNQIAESSNQMAAQEVANQGMIATAKETTAAANMAASTQNAAASQGTVAANTAEMTTSMTAAGGEASKQAAKLPFPANVIAIAGIVTTILGLIATLKGAFASGGIIQGAHNHGDMQLARVNAGEMILNGNQQKHLFNALNSASLATPLSSNGGNVTFRLRGQDLIGSINNYKSKMGKSTI